MENTEKQQVKGQVKVIRSSSARRSWRSSCRTARCGLRCRQCVFSLAGSAVWHDAFHAPVNKPSSRHRRSARQRGRAAPSLARPSICPRREATPLAQRISAMGTRMSHVDINSSRRTWQRFLAVSPTDGERNVTMPNRIRAVHLSSKSLLKRSQYFQLEKKESYYRTC